MRPARAAPPAHALIKGTVAADGALTLAYTTTEFPSQGIQVSVNGNPVSTDMENDVSCLGPSNVLGPRGAFTLAEGLILTESGSETIPITGSPAESTPSPLC